MGEALICAEGAIEFGDVVGLIEIRACARDSDLAAGRKCEFTGDVSVYQPLVTRQIGEDPLRELLGFVC